MGIIAFIILGLFAGLIAKAIMPGNDPGGFIVTALIGIAGALLGGFLAAALFDADPLDEFFDISTWLTAIIGSIILLVVYRLVTNRSDSTRARNVGKRLGRPESRRGLSGRRHPRSRSRTPRSSVGEGRSRGRSVTSGATEA